ncbi:MAG: fibronectin type III domain-containing protein, partial [Kiritimatiellae bacterium]|nr:fibronectin type III domain-containing protein [Kiritimatiellia bacterium]
MKIKSLLLVLLFAFATIASAKTVTIISENFDSLDSARTTAVKASDLPALIDAIANCYAETQDYSKVAYPSRGLRFSNTSNYGSLTTKDFACEPNMPIKIAFKLASYVDEYKGVFEVTVGGQKFTPVPTTVAPNYTDYEIYLENGINASSFDIVMVVPSGTKSGYKSCVVIDDLVITQEILDPDVPAVQLEAPKDLAVANLTHESAVASWTKVDNATKYSVVLVAGEIETTFETTETTFAFENLEAETAYTVKVAAVGNGTTHLTSDYSTAFSFTTEAAPAGGWNVLFYDDLSKVDSGNHTSTSHSAVKAAQVPWAKLETDGVDYSKVYAAGGALKFSTASIQGFVTTTNITFQALKTRITAYVKGWNQKDGTPASFDVVINGQTYSEPFPQAYITSDFAEVVIEIPSVTAGSFPVKITSTNGDDYRFFLDSFKIEQFVSESMTTLPAPTSVEATELTPYSVKVNWSAVAGASSYTVTLQMVDEEGNSVGSSIVNAAGNTETSIVVDGLADGVSYNVSVVAVGDDKILSSEATTISITTPVDTYKPVFTITDAAGKVMDAFEAPKDDPIVIMASAMVGEEAAAVTANNLPEGATFVDGVLTWTPSLELEANTVFTVDFVVTNEGGTYTQSVTIKVVEANTLVVGAITASDITATAATLSWDALPKASSYVYDIWYGSSVITNGVEIESFLDFKKSTAGVIPFGFEIEGGTDVLTDNKDIGFEHNIIKFDKVTGTLITKKYPKAVTALSIYIAKNKADTAEGATGNPVTIYASADDGATWVLVETFTADQLPAKNTFSYDFDAALNYTRFKVEYNKVEMNLGLSCVGVAYASAGAKMFAQNQTTTDTSISITKGLRANTEYFVRIKPVNETRECAYKYIRFV